MKSIIHEDKVIIDVTVLLNIWKRAYFEEQIVAILGQTVLPKEIWILHYEDYVFIHDVVDRFKVEFPHIVVFKSDKNLMFHGRHALAINVHTTFVWLIDDDIIPGKEWLENCSKKCGSLNAIITCSGRIIPKNDFKPEYLENKESSSHYIGDLNFSETINFCPKDTIVDYGCQSYFYKAKWVSTFWSVWPVSFLTGDDIHLSATCKYQLNVNTVVLEQKNNLNTGNTKIQYGRDNLASWKEKDFLQEREKVFKYHILDNGWIPILWKN